MVIEQRAAEGSFGIRGAENGVGLGAELLEPLFLGFFHRGQRSRREWLAVFVGEADNDFIG